MIQIQNEQAMKEIGRALGGAISGSVTLELVGDVGAGKTTFVKGLAVGLGIDEDIQSPSFTVNRTYDARDNLVLSHYDFYRLHDPGIMASEIKEAAMQPDTVVVVEWADIVNNILPAERLTVDIKTTDEMTRAIELTAYGQAAEMLREAVV